MVGLKTFWILIISLMGLAACVPMTKQTECGTNEAFNAGLRTCVPVVGGPSSFINVSNVSPQSTLFLNKTDSEPKKLTITIKNPYSEKYSVEWVRRYNGTPTSLTPFTSGTKSEVTFIPRTIGTQIGTHLFEVVIKDSKNAVVDEHIFTVVISDVPKPIMTEVDPDGFYSEFNPRDPNQVFEVTISNNNASISSSYQTEWRLTRSSAFVTNKDENFKNRDSNATHTSTFDFDPSFYGAGSYLLVARVTDGANQLYGEKEWSISVKHPPLSKITDQKIFKTGPTPAFTTTTVAYSGIPYNQKTTYNFIPTTTPASTAQGNYCVTVQSGTGTYPNDGKFVRVDFYAGTNFVTSATTTETNGTVCLSDNPVDLANAYFTNVTNTAETHYLIARVFDEATEQFYTNGDLNIASPATYPITWRFQVRPPNVAPTVSFGTSATVAAPSVSLCSGSGTTQTCEVNSDTSFTVKIRLDGDDFYSIPTNLDQFGYSLRLYSGENGAVIDECPRVGETLTYNDGFSCTFNVASFDNNGPKDLTNLIHQIKGEIFDIGSPIVSTRATSSSLTWNFTVKEINTSLSVAATVNGTSGQPVDEGSNLNFNLTVTDTERDHFNYEIQYCKDTSCNSLSNPILTGLVNRTSSTNPLNLDLSYTLPQDFLQNTTTLCAGIARNAVCEVKFKITVEDRPDNTAIKRSQNTVISSFIKNINPIPVFNTASSVPQTNDLSATTYPVFVGVPFTIENTAALFSDTSIPSTEKPSRYQWFVKKASEPTWEKIPEATGLNLIWTPSLITVGTSGSLLLKLCIEDQPAAVVPEVNVSQSTCSDSGNANKVWKVTVINNVAKIHDLPDARPLAKESTDAGTETAVWYEAPANITSTGKPASAVYVAMIDNNKTINVKKVLVRSVEGIDTIDSEAVVTFNAFESAAVGEVRELSITGTVDTNGDPKDLYVAYLASKSGNSQFYPQVRHIDISSKRAVNTVNKHRGKMGFTYTGLSFSHNCIPSSTGCVFTPPVAGSPSTPPTIKFDSSGNVEGNFDLKTPLGDYRIFFGDFNNNVDQICTSCTTSTMRQGLMSIINNSTDPKLAGFSARIDGDNVVIEGSGTKDYFDASDLGSFRVSNKVGKIFVAGNFWYLPYIASGSGNKMSFYRGAINLHLKAPTADITTYEVSNLPAVSTFDNYFDGTNLWIALSTYSGSIGKLYQLNSSFDAKEKEGTIFSGQAVTALQVTSSNTQNVFVTAQTTSEKTKIGIYGYNLERSIEYDIDGQTLADSETRDLFNHSSIASMKVVPYQDEARLFSISKTSANASTYKLYVARLRKNLATTADLTDWVLSCGECTPVSELETNISPFVKLDVADIRIGTSELFRLSSDGSKTNEGIRDASFVSFGRIGKDDNGNEENCDPALGVFNMKSEAANTETIFGSGTVDGGLYRNPFIRD